MSRLPSDPLFREQWHLHNTGQTGGVPGVDIRVLPAWEDYTGKGVRVAVFDEGVDLQHRDLARNLEVPHALGMTTVLVVPERTREVFREDWELEGRDAPHIDHVTDDLVGFLRSLIMPTASTA